MSSFGNIAETLKFKTIADLSGLNKLTGAAKKLQNRFKGVKNQSKKTFGSVQGDINKTGTIAEKLGNKFGFMAFQWTFIAGVASRALMQVGQVARDVFDEGASSIAKIEKAALEGFQFGDTLEENNKRMKVFSQFIQEMGSGNTIFSTGEVAEALREVAKSSSDINATLPVTNEVLRLMTIEEVDAAKAAKGFMSVMNNFKLTGEDIARVTHTLVGVNKQSRMSLEEVIHAYEFAGQQARVMGLSIEEAGVMIGMIGDQLPSMTVGRTFSQMLQNFRKDTVALSPEIQSLGVNIYDAEGNIRKMDMILKDMARMMNKAGSESDYFRNEILKLMKMDTRAERVFLALINNIDEFDGRLEQVADGGKYVTMLYEEFRKTPENALKRVNNALGQLKIQLVAGFGPALLQILDTIQTFIKDQSMQFFFKELGEALGKTVVPLMNMAAGTARTLIIWYKKLGLGTDNLAKIITGLGVALGTLAVVGMIATVFFMFMSIVEKVAARFVTFGLASNFASMSLKTLTIGLLRIGAVALGVWILMSGLNRLWVVLSDGLQEGELGAVALALGMTALGAAMVAIPIIPFVGKLGTMVAASATATAAFATMKIALMGIGVAIVGSAGLIGVMALAIAATVALGWAIAQVWKDFADIKPGDDWATLWQKTFIAIAETSATDWQKAFEDKWNEIVNFAVMIGMKVQQTTAGINYWFGLMAQWAIAAFTGDWDRFFDIGKMITDGVEEASHTLREAGKNTLKYFAEGFLEDLASLNPVDLLWNYVMGIDTKYMQDKEAADKQMQGISDQTHPWEETIENVNTSLNTFEEVVTIETNALQEVDFSTTLQTANEAVVKTTEITKETSTELVKEIAAIKKDVEVTSSVITSKEAVDKVLITTKSLAVNDMARTIELIRDKMQLHKLYAWYIDVLHNGLVPETIQTTTDLVALGDRVHLVDAAFQRLAYASDRTVARLASVKLSDNGKFSMDSFGAMPDGMDLSMPKSPQVRDNAASVMNRLDSMRPEAPTYNNNIEMRIDIESIRSEADIEALAGMVADKIVEETEKVKGVD